MDLIVIMRGNWNPLQSGTLTLEGAPVLNCTPYIIFSSEEFWVRPGRHKSSRGNTIQMNYGHPDTREQLPSKVLPIFFYRATVICRIVKLVDMLYGISFPLRNIYRVEASLRSDIERQIT